MHGLYMSVSLSPDTSMKTPPKGLDTRTVPFSPSLFSPVTCKYVMQPSVVVHPSVHHIPNSQADSHMHRDNMSKGKRKQIATPLAQRSWYNAGCTPLVLEGGLSTSTATTPPSRPASPNTSRYCFPFELQ